MQQDPPSRLARPAHAVNPRVPGIRSLHSPGPTRVPDAVVHAMSRPMMDLMDPRVAALIAACESGMQRLLHTRDAQVLFYAANACNNRTSDSFSYFGHLCLWKIRE